MLSINPQSPLLHSSQLPQDLMLYVSVKHDVRPTLQVLKSHSLAIGDIHVTFRIIGESHYISMVDTNGIILQEIFACTALDTQDIHHAIAFKNLRPHRYSHKFYDIRVQFNSTYSPTDAQLRVMFPETHQQIPFTEIGWHHSDCWLQWWTVHSYPTRQDVIFAHTSTRIDLTRRLK